MPITIDPGPDMERRLQEIAEAAGLSPEGYLLTLIEAMTRPKPRAKKTGLLASLRRRPETGAPEPREASDEAVRQMRADLLAYKEQAVEAVTRANVLFRLTDQQQRAIAESELQAMTCARNGARDEALRHFQESCVYGENLLHTRDELKQAAEIAEGLVAHFKQEEAKVKARQPQKEPSAGRVTESEYTRASMTEDRMALRIIALHTSDDWTALFDAWLERVASQNATEPQPARPA